MQAFFICRCRETAIIFKNCVFGIEKRDIFEKKELLRLGQSYRLSQLSKYALCRTGPKKKIKFSFGVSGSRLKLTQASDRAKPGHHIDRLP